MTGPRRSGKSTFVAELQKEWGGGDYRSFDTPLEQAQFQADPEGFVRGLRPPAVLDEVQNVPEIFSYLKKIIDENPGGRCDYILTGSQQFQMMRKVSESLAGRVLIKELLPFSIGEGLRSEVGRVKRNFETLLANGEKFELDAPAEHLVQVAPRIAAGGFPPVVLSNEEGFRTEWYNSYFESYVQRDVRALSNVQDLSAFSRFVSLAAGRTAQIINYSELGKDIGINYKTAQHYLSLLEASYLWRALPPYYKAGSEKRISKSPKGIFTDTGFAMFLIGLHASGLERNSMLGPLFETLVTTELMKLSAAFLSTRLTVCHFRAANSAEVDLVLEHGATITPIEIKCSATPDRSWGRGIRVLREVMRLSEGSVGYVVSLHPKVMQIIPGVINVPLSAFY